MSDFLMHYNHNHDAYGRFAGSSNSRNRSAKRGLNRLGRIDRRATKHFIKGNTRYLIANKPRKKYHQLRWDAGFPLSKLSVSKKADRYARKLEDRIGYEKVDGLNRKQVNTGRRYCLEFVG